MPFLAFVTFVTRCFAARANAFYECPDLSIGSDKYLTDLIHLVAFVAFLFLVFIA